MPYKIDKIVKDASRDRRVFVYKSQIISQTDGMKRVKIFDGDGKSREERETCFPMAGFQTEKNKIKGAGTR